jgi:hypothetical protein
MNKAESGRISYIVGPDGELCTVDASGHWCNEPESEPFQNGSPVAPVEEAAEENFR